MGGPQRVVHFGGKKFLLTLDPSTNIVTLTTGTFRGPMPTKLAAHTIRVYFQDRLKAYERWHVVRLGSAVLRQGDGGMVQIWAGSTWEVAAPHFQRAMRSAS